MIHKLGADGTPLIYVVKSISLDKRYSHQRPQVRPPGGTNSGHPEDKWPEVTAVREAFEETGLLITKPEFLCYFPPTARQLERWYFTCPFEACEGTLRQAAIQDGKDLLFPPYPVSVRELGTTFYRTHHPVIRRLYRHFGLVG